MFRMPYRHATLLLLFFPLFLPRGASAQTAGLERLKQEIARQNARIEELENTLARQAELLEKLVRKLETGPAAAGETRPEITPGINAGSILESKVQSNSKLIQDPGAEATGRSVAGIRLSGDFRYRIDVQARSSNSFAAPLQNIRGRYRFRLNADKDLDTRFTMHFQLSTGPLNNYLTNDQDFAGMAVKHPFTVSEAYLDFHPNRRFSLRGGRMEEAFADNMRFLWDDDVRFNGFHQIAGIPLRPNVLRLETLEFRAGQYLLSNPNVAVLAAGSPYVSARFQPGQKVRSSNLFHQGVIVGGALGPEWSHQLTADLQVYRNPNQIQLSSLASGFPVLISNGVGIALSGPPPGTGNATTTPGGAAYSARNFQIARLAYRLNLKSFKAAGRVMPFWFDLQVSRNAGTSRWRDALMASVNLGAVKNAGNLRFLYQFAIKDPNALISQFTDDDLGTGSGVNVTVHALRFDLGLTRFLQWQNLFFIQHQRRPSIPEQQLFVPLPGGANPTYRYLGQLAFLF